MGVFYVKDPSMRFTLFRLALLVSCCISLSGVELLTINAAVPVARQPPTQNMQERIGSWGFTTKRKQTVAQRGRFVEYTPANWDRSTKLPLLIFYHGAGARTQYRDNIEALYEEYVLHLIRSGKEIPAIVLCPQVATYWNTQSVEFFDQAIAHYHDLIDVDRIYVTGLSSGGGGCWIACAHRHMHLAAAIPICGIRTDPKQDAHLIHLPIWAFHNKHDPYQSVDNTRAHVEVIRNAGGNYLLYTEYDEQPGKSHMKNGVQVFPGCHAHAWITAYDNPQTWTWLFKQRKGSPERAVQP